MNTTPLLFSYTEASAFCFGLWKLILLIGFMLAMSTSDETYNEEIPYIPIQRVSHFIFSEIGFWSLS